MVGHTVPQDNQKIDSFATDGLNGVSNSLAYRVHEIERHLHGREKWFGAAASPSGETHVADRAGGSTSTFALTSGDNDFGEWVQILGSSDTPVAANRAYFDSHRYLVSTTNSTSPFVIQVVGGESADIASKLSNEEFTETIYISATNNNDSGVQEIMSTRVPAGTKVWARCACIGQNGPVINFYIGLHEYEG